jgi:hypothetical protein
LRDYIKNEEAGDPGHEERRRARRVPVFRPVTYFSVRFGETQSRILDLSVGGAYIESPVVPAGSEIELEFSLVGGYQVRAVAVVRYVVLGSGMGVEFIRMTEESRSHIEGFVNSFHAPLSVQGS